MTQQCLRKCCYCCRLKSGTYFAAIFHLIVTVLALIYCIAGKYGSGYNRIAIGIAGLIQLMAVIFLLLGVCNRKPKWMIFYLVLTIIQIIIAFISALFEVLDGPNQSTEAIGSGIFVILLYTGFMLYFWFVVQGHYAELQNESHRRVYNRPYA